MKLVLALLAPVLAVTAVQASAASAEACREQLPAMGAITQDAQGYYGHPFSQSVALNGDFLEISTVFNRPIHWRIAVKDIDITNSGIGPTLFSGVSGTTLYLRYGGTDSSAEDGEGYFAKGADARIVARSEEDAVAIYSCLKTMVGESSAKKDEDGDLLIYSNVIGTTGANSFELRVKNNAVKASYRLLSYALHNCSGIPAGQCGMVSNGASFSLMTLTPGEDRLLKVIPTGNNQAKGDGQPVSFDYSWVYVGTHKGATQRSGSGQTSAAASAEATPQAIDPYNPVGIQFVPGREPRSLQHHD